jgi:hypothetical protein
MRSKIDRKSKVRTESIERELMLRLPLTAIHRLLREPALLVLLLSLFNTPSPEKGILKCLFLSF